MYLIATVPECPAVNSLPGSTIDYGDYTITVSCLWGYTFDDGSNMRTYVCLRKTATTGVWHLSPQGCEGNICYTKP